MVSVVSLYIIVYQRAFTIDKIIAQRIFAYEKGSSFLPLPMKPQLQTVFMFMVLHPGQNIIRKSANIIAIATQLKMIF